MAKSTPKQTVAGNFDGKWKGEALQRKEKIVKELLPFLDRKQDESEDDLKNRLLGKDGTGVISNGKLLKLQRVVARLKADFSGKKENLVVALLEAKKGASGKTDADYKVFLNKKSTATLLLTFDHLKKTGNL